MIKTLSERLLDIQSKLEKADNMLHNLNTLDINISQFFNIINDPLIIAHADGYFKIVNNACLEILGYSMDELTTHKWIDFVHPDDIEKTIEVGENLATKPCFNFINHYCTKNGSYIKLSWNARQTNDGYIYAVARVLE